MGIRPRVVCSVEHKFSTGEPGRRPNYLDRALELSEGEITTETDSSSGEENDSEAAFVAGQAKKRINRFKIPKMKKTKIWTSEQLENFRKNWPNLKNFADSVLQSATLSELTAMGKQKFRGPVSCRTRCLQFLNDCKTSPKKWRKGWTIASARFTTPVF
jgi:hypothetical protein